MKNNNEKIEEVKETNKPKINVLSKTEFESKIEPVFKILGETLGRSFGPYGSNTFISSFPYLHTTKDGFSIMKHITWDNMIDRVISNMAENICTRLNSKVGDGTTSSIIATNEIYKSYKNNYKNKNVMPRDVISNFEEVKNTIIDKILSMSKKIDIDNSDELYNMIRQVVNISSNGNDEITDAISYLYKEIKYPAIDVVLSPTGKTEAHVITGYSIDISLTDGIYINSDDRTLKTTDVDTIVFTHKVTSATYKYILKPLNEQCRARKRHLLVIAPFYDDIALQGTIRQDLLGEYQKTKDINMILSVCTNTTTYAKNMLNDLAMLMNTIPITKQLEEDIIEELTTNNKSIMSVINMDYRNIPNIIVMREDTGGMYLTQDKCDVSTDNKYILRLGFCKNLSIGLKNSVFSGFYYDEDIKKTYEKDALEKLTEVQKKYNSLGTFNIEISMAMKRYYALSLKMGVIEVGGESEIMQGYLKDAVDDAVRAAASAYHNGVILGCNVDLLRCITDIYDSEANSNKKDILNMLKQGFIGVYKCVLGNMFNDIEYNPKKADEFEKYQDIDKLSMEAMGCTILETVKSEAFVNAYDNSKSLMEFIINYSINSGVVFDLTTRRFNTEIINSCETDIEILKATIDLISLIISGNQLVMGNQNR